MSVHGPQVLVSYDCSQAYGYHDCSACQEAYMYWVCAAKLPACTSGRCVSGGAVARCLRALVHVPWCGFVSGGVEVCGSSGCETRQRMCASLCQDVVRKCPFNLGFECPEVRGWHMAVQRRRGVHV